MADSHFSKYTGKEIDSILDGAVELDALYRAGKLNGKDGADGSDGNDASAPVVTYKVSIFKRSEREPPTPVGGSASVPPSGWYDHIPDGTYTVWMSSRTFYSDDSVTTLWSSPQPISSSSSTTIVYSILDNPPLPTTKPFDPSIDTAWSKTSATATKWMATLECVDGVYGDWQMTKIQGEKGDKGDDAKPIIAQYSVNGINGWHDTFQMTDKWMRQSTDGGVTWTDPILIVGEKGDCGDYTDYSFAISADYVLANEYIEPSTYDGWHDTPILVNDAYPFLWMKTVKMKWDKRTDGYLSSAPTFTRLNGKDGKDGEDGKDSIELRLHASATQIKKSLAGTNLPRTISVARYKKEGGETSFTRYDIGYVFYRIDEGEYKAYSIPIDTSLISDKIDFLWVEESNTSSKQYDFLTIASVSNGKDGDSVKNVGKWYDGLYVPYLGMVRMGNATYQCINPEGTYNPPVKIYSTDTGELLTYDDNGYVLSDELNDEEYRLVAKDGSNGNGSLVMGLSERTVGIQAIKKGSSYEAYADTDIRIAVVATYDNESIYPAVSGQSTLNGCTYSGTTDVIVRIPKGTSFRLLSVLYRCTLSYSIGEKTYEQECVVKAMPDTSFMHVKEDFDKALGEMKDFSNKVQDNIDKVADITNAVVVVKDVSGNPTGEVRIGSLTISKNEISITDSNKNKAIIVPNIENGGGMRFCPSAPNSDCQSVPIGSSTSGGGGTLTPSDMRHKHVIEDIELDVEQIADAPIFDFTFKGNSMKHSGTSAQYWQKVLPNVVRGDDMLMMEYAQAAMVAVVSLAREVRELKMKLNERQ